jgi:hypothetical protein
MEQKNVFPDLAYLAKRFPICACIAEILVNSECVRRKDRVLLGARATTHAHGNLNSLTTAFPKVRALLPPLWLKCQQCFIGVKKSRGILLVHDNVLKDFVEAFPERIMCGGMIAGDDIASGKRGIDGRCLFGPTKVEGINRALFVQARHLRKIEKDARDRTVPNLGAGIPVPDVDFGVTSIDRNHIAWKAMGWWRSLQRYGTFSLLLGLTDS